MGAPVFAIESVAALWDEVQPLLEAHWHEIAHYDDIALNVDREMYAKIEEVGALRCYTVRVDGALVGYAAFVVRKNMHYRDSLQAVQDVLYVDPAHRRSRIGLNLMAYADDALRSEGVQVVYHHSKCAHDFGPILERLGYERVEYIYARRLDR